MQQRLQFKGSHIDSIEAASHATRLFPPDTRQRVMKLFQDGTIRPGDVDYRAMMNLQSLTEPLQTQVLNHLERERVFLTNARSKSGFLVSVCEKAKRGELDVRGFGIVDPWRQQLLSICESRRDPITLVDEDAWIETHPHPVMVSLDCSLVGGPSDSISASVHPTETILELKEKIARLGLCPHVPLNRMQLKHGKLSVLKNYKTIGFYNFGHEVHLEVFPKFRGGRRINKPE